MKVRHVESPRVVMQNPGTLSCVREWRGPGSLRPVPQAATPDAQWRRLKMQGPAEPSFAMEVAGQYARG